MAAILERTWQHSWNYTLDTSSATNQAKNMIWFFKAFLMGQLSNYYNGDGSAVGGTPTGAWTCYYSCDGTTAGTANDGVDRWTSTYNSAKIVQAAAGSAHSWFVLKSPAGMGPVYVIYDCSNATAQNLGAIVLAKTAPTGGTTTARPTSTDETSIANPQISPTQTVGRVHGSITTTGDFFFIGTGAGTGTCTYLQVCQSLSETKSGDTMPVVMQSMYSSTIAITPGNIGANNIIGRNHDNTATLTGLIGIGLNTFLGVAVAATQAIDYGDQLVTDLPYWIWNNQTGQYTIKGRYADIRVGTSQMPLGWADPNPQNPRMVLMGCMWFPTYTMPVL